MTKAVYRHSSTRVWFRSISKAIIPLFVFYDYGDRGMVFDLSYSFLLFLHYSYSPCFLAALNDHPYIYIYEKSAWAIIVVGMAYGTFHRVPCFFLFPSW